MCRIGDRVLKIYIVWEQDRPNRLRSWDVGNNCSAGQCRGNSEVVSMADRTGCFYGRKTVEIHGFHAYIVSLGRR